MRINAAISTLPLIRVQQRQAVERRRPPAEAQVPEVAAVFRRSQEEPEYVLDYGDELRKRAHGEKEEDEATVSEDEKGADGQKLDEDEKARVDELESRDQEVQTHEQSHMAAAGAYAQGGVQLEFEQGPDGKRYAVGGHVSISTGEESTPERTIAKMQQVRRAALAPSNPSSADMSVAQSASAKEMRARQELQAEMRDKSDGLSEDSPVKKPGSRKRQLNGIDLYKNFAAKGPSTDQVDQPSFSYSA